MLSSGVFRRETASGFYPWCNVEGPRKRVAEGLCGWRHRNSFPMTQSAQSHRQMRSIPLCSKAVFYVFVFDSIHDSAIMHNFSTEVSRPYHAKSFGRLIQLLPRNHFIVRVFSPKASGFYPWAMWKTLARGWRRDCAVGGMETRFQ